MGREQITLGDGAQITYIKPSELVKGAVIEGTYLGRTKNADQFGKLNHRITLADGTSAIINAAGKLDRLMEKVEAGSDVEIVYLGKDEIQSGEHAGKKAHNFDVFVTGAASQVAAGDDVPF